MQLPLHQHWHASAGPCCLSGVGSNRELLESRLLKGMEAELLQGMESTLLKRMESTLLKGMEEGAFTGERRGTGATIWVAEVPSLLTALLVSSEMIPRLGAALPRTLRYLSWADLLAILSQAMPVSAAVRILAKRGVPLPSSMLRTHTKPGRPAGDATKSSVADCNSPHS